jgi:hypothetical protein
MVEHKRFWNEQYFLECFLAFNETYRVRFPIYYLSRKSYLLKEILDRRRGPDKPMIKDVGYSFYLSKSK